MASLREVKDRIASVRSTLKITSAMKLVASSKLRRAQRTIEALRPYEQAMTEILSAVSGTAASATAAVPTENWADTGDYVPGPMVVLAISSNSSMCGAFNANVIRKTTEVLQGCEGPVEVWAFGRKIADAMRKISVPAARDYSHMVGHTSFDDVAAVAAELRGLLASGAISGAVLVYNHFVSTGRQEVVVESYLSAADSFRLAESGASNDDEDFIMEPSGEELLEELMPQVMDLRLYAALLDSEASEHAARMIAMQTATDNAEELLGELTLEYNKGRQQKITSEILDLVSGEARGTA